MPAETPAAVPYPDAPAFNLLDEPWLPVRWRDGRTESVGLLSALRHAGEIEGLAETSPPAYVALHRVLLAVTHRALTSGQGRWTLDDRARWYEHGLPTDTLAGYLTQWRERFWLFHPTQPFMQVAALRHPVPPKSAHRFGATDDADGDKATSHLEPKPWTQIALESVSGNNAVVFDHAVDDSPLAVAPAVVLRHLLAYLQYAPGQPVKTLCKSGNDLSGPLFNSASVIPLGVSLAKTILLSLPPPGLDDHAADLPAWESEPLSLQQIMAPPTVAVGANDRYTRLTRACLLLPGVDGQVRHLLFAEGRALQDDPMAPDPMNACSPGNKGTWVPVSFNEGKAFWRDLGALLPDAGGSLARPAKVIDQAIRLMQAAGDDRPLDFVAAGLAAKRGKMLRGRIERHRLPQAVLASAELAQELRAELRRAEDFHDAMRKLAQQLVALSLPDPDHRDTWTRARKIVANGPLAGAFFSAIERDLPALLGPVSQSALDQAHSNWSLALHAAAQQAWRLASTALGSSARSLRARALLHDRFLQLIDTLRPKLTNSQPAAQDTATEDLTT